MQYCVTQQRHSRSRLRAPPLQKEPKLLDQEGSVLFYAARNGQHSYATPSDETGDNLQIYERCGCNGTHMGKFNQHRSPFVCFLVPFVTAVAIVEMESPFHHLSTPEILETFPSYVYGMMTAVSQGENDKAIDHFVCQVLQCQETFSSLH